MPIFSAVLSRPLILSTGGSEEFWDKGIYISCNIENDIFH